MKFISTLFVISASALVSGMVGGADARLSKEMVQRSVEGADENGHLHILARKAEEPKRHRSRRSNKKRGSCGSSSSASTTAQAGAAYNANAVVASSSASSAKAAATAVSPLASSNSTSSSSSASGSASALGAISGFSGTNSGIGSWFRTNSGQDSTNGRSWCQLNYQDSWMGFAPSVGTMLNNFGGDTNTAGKAYCGREAKATNPNNGKTALIYIVDGFDDKWVKTPGSIDLTVAAFTALYGSFDGNKNTVIQNLQWEFTGNVNEAYTFNSGS